MHIKVTVRFNKILVYRTRFEDSLSDCKLEVN